MKLIQKQLIEKVYERLCQDIGVDIGEFNYSEKQEIEKWYTIEHMNFEKIIMQMKKTHKIYYKSLKK